MAKIHVWLNDSGKHYAVTIGADLIHFDDQSNFATTLKRRRVRTGRAVDHELLRRVQVAAMDEVAKWAQEQELPF